MRKERGITLVALVITVIVLIILAGITLDTLVGENGIITKAQEAKQNMENAATEENMLIQNLLNELKGIETGEGEIEIPEGTIEFGEVTWNNGQAEVTILANTVGNILQYQVNGTEEENWKEISSGEKVTKLHHGDEVHARLWNGNTASVNKSKKIEDTNVPKVEIIVGEVTSNSIAVTVEVTEEESGLVETETYEYYLGEALDGKSVSNQYIYDELEEETTYTLTVKVQDKAGNIGEKSIEVTTEKVVVDSRLTEGKYVWYTDATGTQRKCIVLYGVENANFETYGVQIIAADTLVNASIGNSNFNTSKNEYNTAISLLNDKADAYRKQGDGIAIEARCVGSIPDNPDYDGAGYFTSSDRYMQAYNGVFKNMDTNYLLDYTQMQKLSIVNTVNNYFLASRDVQTSSTGTSFSVRVLASNRISNSLMCKVNLSNTAGGVSWIRLWTSFSNSIRIRCSSYIRRWNANKPLYTSTLTEKLTICKMSKKEV